MHPGTLLNVNIPNVPESEIKGVKITKQGKSFWEDSFEVRADPNGRDYYWLTGRMKINDTSNEFDIAAVMDNYVSITPLHYDLTDYQTYEELKDLKIKLKQINLRYEVEKEFKVIFEGNLIGTFRSDLVVEDSVIVELKAVVGFQPKLFKSQVISYLKASKINTGLLINFGNSSCEVNRFVI